MQDVIVVEVAFVLVILVMDMVVSIIAYTVYNVSLERKRRIVVIGNV